MDDDTTYAADFDAAKRELSEWRADTVDFSKRVSIVLPHYSRKDISEWTQEMVSWFPHVGGQEIRRTSINDPLRHTGKPRCDLGLYLRLSDRSIVEIQSFFDKVRNRNVEGIKSVSMERISSAFERKFSFYCLRNEGRGVVVRLNKSLDANQIKQIIANDIFIQTLPVILRVSHSPIFYLDGENLAVSKRGYNEKIATFVFEDSPDVELMPLSEAKQIIDDCLEGFCWQDEKVDKVLARAYLLTPALRNIYSGYGVRTPTFLLSANRPRAGKDYLAATRSLIYQGKAIEESPISSDKGSDSEELRKRVTACLAAGDSMFHSSNNRGNLQNAIFEQLCTASTWKDRQLGSNQVLEFENILEISLSANIGLTYTEDAWERMRPIRLFFGEENPNARKFSKDLHAWIIANRGKILSAIYTCIHSWLEAGGLYGKTPFTSYPEWAKVCGGLMQFLDMGDPCQVVALDDAVGGDKQTRQMKAVFQCIGDWQNAPGRDKELENGITKSKMSELLQEQEESIWPDINEKSGSIKFGKAIELFKGRILGNYRLELVSDNAQGRRRMWKFGIVGIVGNTVPPAIKKIDNSRDTGIHYANIANIAKNDTNIVDPKCTDCGSTSCGTFLQGKPYCQQCTIKMLERDDSLSSRGAQ